MRWLAALLLLAPTLSFAHGPAPAALGAHGYASPLDLIRTNIGLAMTLPEGGVNYVCPAMWESDEQFPPVAQLPDGRAVIVHRGTAYIVAADGCARETLTLPDAGIEAATVAWGDAVVTVTREAEGSTLWRIDGDTPPQVVTRFAMRVDSVQLDATGALVLAAARPEPVRYRFAGEQLEEQALPFVASFIAVRGEGRFLRASTDQGIVLVEQGADRWIEVLRAERSVHGPVRFEDGWLVLADGRLHRRAGDAGAFTADVEVDWTCLQSAGSHAVACQNFGLVTVLPDLTTQPAFELMAFDGVQCATEAAQDRCDGQWLHFAAEAGLLRPSAPETAPMPAPTASNDDCNHAPGAPPGPVPWLALALIGWIATLRAKA